MTEPPPSEAQDDIFELLANPATYASTGAVTEVRRHQTHAAVVFLAGGRAFKVKRAVRYPFLDFFLIFRHWLNGKPRARPNSKSIANSRPSSIAGSCQSHAKAKAHLRSAAQVKRSSGPWR